MRVDEIKLTNFRCYKDHEFELNSSFNLIVGDNGQGKTAILDGLWLSGVWSVRLIQRIELIDEDTVYPVTASHVPELEQVIMAESVSPIDFDIVSLCITITNEQTWARPVENPWPNQKLPTLTGD